MKDVTELFTACQQTAACDIVTCTVAGRNQRQRKLLILTFFINNLKALYATSK